MTQMFEIVISNPRSFLKEREWADEVTVLVLCPLFHVLSHMTDFYQILYERYAIGDHCNFVHVSFLQRLIITWRTRELLNWVGPHYYLIYGSYVVHGN